MNPSALKVGIVQASSIYLDLEASLAKAIRLIAEAADQGAKLVVFGETWLPGYPAWLDHCPEAALWNYEPTKEVYARLRRNSVLVPGKECELLAHVAREHEIVLVMGVNERVASGPGSGTLYNSLLTFSSEGLINHHRKLMPTFSERMVWGQGDGVGLQAIDTPVGRVGGLICWEHWMPLARQALHESGEQIHIAVWPTVHEMHQIASRHYAFEARSFVLAAGLIMKAEELPDELARSSELMGDGTTLVLSGGSAVIAPDGSYVAGPVFGCETILLAELDLGAIDRERMTLDVAGHYHRPDVFKFKVRRKSHR